MSVLDKDYEDAERYRWLKEYLEFVFSHHDGDSLENCTESWWSLELGIGLRGTNHRPDASEMDAMIDEAREASND